MSEEPKGYCVTCGLRRRSVRNVNTCEVCDPPGQRVTADLSDVFANARERNREREETTGG